MSTRKISVKVIPNARKNLVKQAGDTLKAYLTAPPVDNKANKLLVEVIADHFGTKKSHVRIIQGHKSHNKVVEIL